MSHPRGTDPGPDEPHSHSLAADDIIRVKVKAELRKRLRGVRKTAPLEACAERRRRSSRALEAHRAMKSARRAWRLFWPIVKRHEVDLRPLRCGASRARRARSRIRRSIPNRRHDVSLRRRRREPRRRGLRIRRATSHARPSRTQLDVIIVPAIAVDPTGHRIGYGAGYYDRTLPKYAPPGSLARRRLRLAAHRRGPGDAQRRAGRLGGHGPARPRVLGAQGLLLRSFPQSSWSGELEGNPSNDELIARGLRAAFAWHSAHVPYISCLCVSGAKP